MRSDYLAALGAVLAILAILGAFWRDEGGRTPFERLGVLVDLIPPPGKILPSADYPSLGKIIYEEQFAQEAPDPERTLPDPEPAGSRKLPSPEAVPPPVEPAPAASRPPPSPDGAPRIALVIDDLGYNGPVSRGIARLDGEVTLAILPGGRFAREIAKIGSARGKELILHQPMEPKKYPEIDPGPGKLLRGMDAATVERVLFANLDRFPEVAGINNHMGSRLTEVRPVMRSVMAGLKKRGDLYFLDSRTSPRTVARAEAAAAGLMTLKRDIFIDNVEEEPAILRQLRKLEKKARVQGFAVGIGHPYAVTLSALKKWLPLVRKRGFKLVKASALLEAPEVVTARR